MAMRGKWMEAKKLKVSLKIGNLDGGRRGKVLAKSKYFSLLLLAVLPNSN